MSFLKKIPIPNLINPFDNMSRVMDSLNGIGSFKINQVMDSLNGIGQFKTDVYVGTMKLATDINTKLATWVDNLKGKSNNPDEYFPKENYQIIYQIDRANPELVVKIAYLGARLRDAETDEERELAQKDIQDAFKEASLLLLRAGRDQRK